MKYDKIEKIDGALFQHGTSNNRLYLMKWDGKDERRVLETITHLLADNNYTKAFIKIPEEKVSVFKEYGFLEEARIPSYYNTSACVFMGLFRDPSRSKVSEDDKKEIEKNLSIARGKQIDGGCKTVELSSGFTLRSLNKGDCASLAQLYRLVFKSYPFPIHTGEYLEKTMDENILYFGIFLGDSLVAASSAEMDFDTSSVELSDFAVNPSYRGKSFANVLLAEMEKEMKKQGIKTLYTIARALSAGMNCTFAKAGYEYSGTLVNNTNISGAIESMNVWYKK